jgi:hypothetical protein
VHPSDGRRLKINRIDDQPKKRYADYRWVDHEEEEDQGFMEKRTMVPTWFEKKPKEKGSALEESRTEASGDQEEIGVASERQA